MNNKNILNVIMHEKYCTKLTICGSYRYRELKEKYQAYYTIKNNVVFMPIKYMSIKEEIEKDQDPKDIAKTMASIHFKKIDLSDAIIVVTGDKCYFGDDTQKEIDYSWKMGKLILFSNVPDSEKDNYYCNNDENYPLYILKEAYI